MAYGPEACPRRWLSRPGRASSKIYDFSRSRYDLHVAQGVRDRNARKIGGNSQRSEAQLKQKKTNCRTLADCNVAEIYLLGHTRLIDGSWSRTGLINGG